MKFVDRKDDMKRLKEVLAKKKASLVVVYDRRRLGKSTLVKKKGKAATFCQRAHHCSGGVS